MMLPPPCFSVQTCFGLKQNKLELCSKFAKKKLHSTALLIWLLLWERAEGQKDEEPSHKNPEEYHSQKGGFLCLC